MSITVTTTGNVDVNARVRLAQAIFIDARVPDLGTLLAGAAPDSVVHVLGEDRDGIAQIADILAAGAIGDLAAISIVAHGAPGALTIGATRLDAEGLAAHADALAQIGAALACGGSLLLFACEVAQGAAGRRFVADLSHHVGAAVAAASHPVGAASRGGSWELDVATGPTAAGLAFSAETLAAYRGVLAAPVLDSTKTPVLNTELEDAGVPSGAVGTLVSSLVDLNPPAGGLDNVTDADSVVTGIALTSVSLLSGSWHYSTNNGVNWTAVPALSSTAVLLLAADANTRLYFQPDPNFNGPVTNAIQFRAWDQSAGSNGATVDPATVAASLSTATDFADITVTAVDDAYTWGGAGSSTTTTNYNLATNWGPTLDAPPDVAGENAIFANTGNATISVTAPVSPDAWTFAANAQAYAVSGAAVTFGGSGVTNLANAGQSISIANVLAGTGGVTQNGASTLTLSGANTYTGVTNVNAGVLRISNNDALGSSSSSSDTTVASGAALELQHGTSITLFEDLTIAGTGVSAGGALRNVSGTNFVSTEVTLTAAARIESAAGTLYVHGVTATNQNLTLGGAGDGEIFGPGIRIGTGTLTKDGAGTWTLANSFAGTYTGATSLNAGTLRLGHNAALGTTAAGTTAADGTTLDYANGVAIAEAITLAGTTNGVTFNQTGGSATQSGVIDGVGGALTKTGSGVLILSGTNTYSGATDVNAGTLIVNGSIANSTTTVNTGATLKGTGNVGALTVESGGHLAPGNSPGTTTTTDFTLNSGATLDIEIQSPGTTAGTDYDQVIASGTVTLGGDLQTILLGGFNPVTGQTYTIILNNGTNAVSGTFANVGATFTQSGSTYAITYTGGGGDNNDVILTALNDASTLAGLDPATFAENTVNASPQLIDTDVTFADVDSPDLNTGNLTVTYSVGGGAQDQLSIANAGGITVTAGVVSFGGNQIGTITTNGANGANLVVTFDSAFATPTAVDALIQALAYQNTSDTPTATRTISVTVNDGDGGTSAASTSLITVTAENDAPTLVGLDPATFNENTVNASPQLIDTDVTFADADSADLNTGNLTVTYSVGGGAQDQLSIANAGGITVTAGVVSFGGNQIGTITTNGANGANLVVTFDSAFATPTAVDALIQALAYRNTSDTPTATRTISVTVNDGDGGTSAPSTSLITVTAENDAPTLAGLDPATFAENTVNASPQLIDTDVTFADVDSADLNTGNLTVTYSVGGGAQDQLSIANAGGITVAAGVVSFGGNQIGTITTNGANGANLVVTFDSAFATPTAVDALIQALAYRNTSDAPTATRTISVTVNDGDGGTSAASTSLITVTAENDAPTLAGLDPATFAENTVNASPQLIDTDVTFADVDSADLNTGNLTVSYSVGGGAQDQLSIANAGGITVTGGNVVNFGGNQIGTFTGGANGTTLVVTFDSAFATPTAVDALIQALAYRNTSDTPTATRTISVTVNDGDGGTSAASTSLITVTAQNDPPDLTPDAPAAASFTEGALTPTALLDLGAIADPDNATDFAGGSFQVQITTNPGAADQIVLRAGSGFHVNGGNLEIDVSNIVVGAITGLGTTNVQVTGFSANVTPSVANNLSRAFAFTNPAQDPENLTRTVTFTFNDGDGGTATDSVTQQVQVTPVNDQPTLTASPANAPFNEGAGNAQGAAVLVFASADASTVEAGQGIISLKFTVGGLHDGANETIRVDGTTFALTAGTNGTTATNGMAYTVSVVGNALAGQTATVTLTKASPGVAEVPFETLINGIQYQNINVNAPTPGARAFTLTEIKDSGPNGGVNNDDNTAALNTVSNVNVIAVNDAPLNAVPGAAVAAQEDTPIAITGISVTDVDASPQNVQMTLHVNNGILDVRTDVAGGVDAAHVTGDTTGTVVLTGTTAQITATLGAANGLIYQGNLNFDGADTLSVTTNDLGHTGTPGAQSDGPDNVTINVANVTANTLSAVQTTVLASTSVAHDVDQDGQIDPPNPNGVPPAAGDIVVTTVQITNNSATTTALNVTLTEANPLNGMTQIGNPNVSPRALDDSYTTIANTLLEVGNATTQTGPQASVAGSVVTNDVEFFSDTFVISAVGATTVVGNTTTIITANGATVTMVTDNLSADRGSFTYAPAPGFSGTDSFTYTIKDDGIDGIAGNADDLTGTGTVTISVATPKVWYVDSNAGPGGDGTSTNPFDSLADVSGASGPDAAGDIIYVREGAGYNGNITLLSNQQLIGGGVDLVVGGFTLKTAASEAGATNLSTTAASTDAITLASGNTVRGFAIGNTTGAGIFGSNVGTLFIGDVSDTGTGKIIDITGAGGNSVSVTLDTATTTSSGTEAIKLTGINGAFTASSGSIAGVTGTDVLVSGGTAAVSIASSIASSAGGSIEVTGHTGASGVTFSGDLNISGGTGISVHDNSGSATIAFTNADADAQVINTGTGNAISLVNNTGLTINFTGGGLDVDTTTGTAFTATGGGTVNVGTGTLANTVNTTTGQVLNWNGVSVGASNVTFGTLGASGTVANTAISLSNVDGSGTFSGGNVTVAATSGATSDAIRIDGGSAATFSFTSATIGSNSNNVIGDDGIELSGANGAVTFSTVSINGTTDAGIVTSGNTSAINISGGSIGNTNDSGGIGVDISGGTGNITVDATINDATAANAIVQVGSRAAGAGTVDFNGNITSTGGGINLTGNTAGTVRFDGGMTLSTGANTAFNSSGGSTGATLVITDPSGATNNTITTTSGSGLTISNTTIGAEDLTFQSITAGTGAGSAGVGISLDTTGTSGGLSVTGTGAANSGGIIQHKTGADGSTTSGIGIYLNNTSEVKLNNMNLHDFDNLGIFGVNVNGIKVTNSTIGGTIGTSTGSNDAPVAFGTTDPGGTNGFANGSSSLFDNVDISGSIEHNFEVYQQSNTFNLTIQNSSIHDNSVTLGSDGLLIETSGTAHGIIKVDNVTFDDNKSQAVQANALGTSHLELTLNNNDVLTSTQGNEGFVLQNGASGDLTVAVTNNTFTGVNGTNILVGNVVNNATTAAELNATVSGNLMTLDGPAVNRTLIAFFSSTAGNTPTSKVLIDGNTINTIADPVNGIAESLFVSTPDANTSPLVYATVSNNVVNIDDNNHLALRGIAVQSTQTTSVMHADVRGNDVNYLDGAPAGVNGIRVRQVAPATLDLEPGVGGANAAAVLAANNPLSTTEIVGTVTVSANNNTALQPSNPATPSLPSFLEAAPGGVEAASPLQWQVAGVGDFNGDGWADALVLRDDGLVGVGTINGDPAQSGILGQLQSGWQVAGVGDINNDGTSDILLQNAGGAYQAELIRDNAIAATVDLVMVDGVLQVAPPAPAGTGAPANQPPVQNAPPPASAHPVIVDDGVLTQAELDYIVDAAIARWTAAGLTDEQVATLKAMHFSVADMSGFYLGQFSPGSITLDSDAASRGWFLDTTPLDDSEFGTALSATRMETNPNGAPAGHYDLLTTVMHEMGHALGLGDSYAEGDRDDLMFGWLYMGERRVAAAGEAANAAAGSITSEEFLAAPINIGSLRPGETVTVQWLAQIDPQTNQFIANPSNQGTVTSSNFASTTTNTSVTTLDTLALGDVVWVDAAGSFNGTFDAGEGVDGVTLRLYADTNASGGLDAGDALLASTTTAGGGLYSFTGLAPGDYIVAVLSTNFDPGGALYDAVNATPYTSIAGNPDPDNNQNNDDNGGAVGGVAGVSIASLPITLAYNTEPTNGVNNDTNNTLDLGFAGVPPNQAPVITTAGVLRTFSETGGGAAVTLEPTLDIDDPDTPDNPLTLDSATVTITDFFTGDLLEFTAGFGITGGFAGGILSLNGTASIANYETVLHSVTYRSASDNPTNFNTNTDRVISWQVNDGTQNSALANTTVSVVAENDAPSLNNVAANAVYLVGGPATTLDTTLSVIDPDNQNLAGATVTITDFSPGDELRISGALNGVTSGVTFSYNGSGLLTLSGPATLAIYEGLLEQVQYSSTDPSPSDGAPASADHSRTVQWQLNDGSPAFNLSATQTTTVLVDAAPVLDLDADGSDSAPPFGYDTTFEEDAFPRYVSGNPVSIGSTLPSGITITDVDDPSANIASATVKLTNAFAGDVLTVLGSTADDSFDFGSGSPISWVINTSVAGEVTITLTGSAPKGDYEAALQTINFENTSNTPNTTNRNITVFVNDGTTNSNTATATIHVVAVNDAPVNAVPAGPLSVNEDTDLSITGISMSDVDAGSANVTVTLHVNSGTLDIRTDVAGGITGAQVTGDTTGNVVVTAALAEINATLAAANGLLYHGTLNFNGGDQLTVTTNDNGNTGTDPDTLDPVDANTTSERDVDTVNINVAAVNDAPVNSVPLVAQTVNEDTNLVFSAGNGNLISISDVDAGSDDIRITLGVTNGTLTLATTAGLIFSTGDGTQDATMTFDGTLAEVNAALNGLTYKGQLNFFGGDTLTLTTNDLGHNGADPGLTGGATSEEDVDSVTINVAAVNDTPVNTVPAAAQAVNEDTDLTFNTANGNRISVADVDANPDDVRVTLTVASGTLTLATTAGLSFSAGDGTTDATMTFDGTVAEVNAALDGLIYRGNLNYFGGDTLSITTNDLGHNGLDPSLTGTATDERDTDTVTINVASINDAPVFTPGASPFGDTPTFTENGPAIVLDVAPANNAVTDAELAASGNYAGAKLIVSRVSPGTPLFEDIFGGSGSLAFLEVDVEVGGVAIGTYTQQEGILEIDFNASATGARVNDVLRQLTYLNTNDAPPASVDIGFTLIDNNDGTQGSGGPLSGFGHIVVTITPTNDPPSLFNVAQTAAYQPGTAGSALSPSLAVSDPDGPPAAPATSLIAGATVTISAGFVAGDLLSVDPVALAATGITASYNPGTHILTLSGTKTVSDYQQVLDTVTYSSSNPDPGSLGATPTRTIQWQATDTLGAASAITTETTTLLHFAFAPTVDLDGSAAGNGFATAFTENGAPISVADTDISVTDPDSTELTFAVVKLTNALAGDSLSVSGALPSGIVASVDTSTPGEITVSLNGLAAPAAYQTAIRQVVYSNSSDNPDTTPRDIIVFASDDELVGNTAHTTVTMIAVNDAPVLASVSPTASYRIHGPPVTLAAALSISDLDNTTLASATVRVSAGTFVGDGDILAVAAGGLSGTSITASYNAATETLTLSGNDTLAHYQQALDNVTFETTGSNPTNSGANRDRTIEWQLNDGAAANNLSTPQHTNVHLTVPLTSDFNADGKGDLFWTTDSSPLAIWEMNGFQISFADYTRLGASAVGLPGPDWHILDTGDTNADGRTDLLWRTDSGKLAVWLMDGNHIVGADYLKIGSTVINAPGTDWHALGALDANGDGRQDLLWRTDSGALAVWQLNGNQITGADYLRIGSTQVGVPGPDWHIVGDGDFDGDGKGGLLWRTDSGALATWELNGNQIKSAAFVKLGTTTVGAPGPDWHVVDVADFDGDGKADILWRVGPGGPGLTPSTGLEPGGGQLAIWLMDGNQIKAADYTRLGSTIVGAPGPDWHLLGADDNNGDGKADLLWRTDSGALAEWQMDGTHIVAADYLRIGGTAVGAPGPDWHVYEHKWDIV